MTAPKPLTHSCFKNWPCTSGHELDWSLLQTFGTFWISYIHNTSDFRKYCYVGNTAQQCRLRLFQDSDFAEDLQDSKSKSGGIFMFFGEGRTFVPISWVCKRQVAVSFSSSDSAVKSLDAGLGMNGIPTLDSRDLFFEVLHSSLPSSTGTGRPDALHSQCEKDPGIRTKMKPPTLREMLFERV